MTTIQAQLHERLLPELRRFFGGRLAALREVLQNAYRAGATNVTITTTGNILTIEDDGQGCPDPQLLLAAGNTGWKETEVHEPAGLGFYSLFHESVATAIHVQSRDWAVHLIPDHVLARKPINVEALSPPQRGFRLRIILVSAQGIEDDIRAARGYYPFCLTLNGADVPVHQWQPTWEIATPVGRVGVRWTGYSLRSKRRMAIWEYRAIHGDAFSNALERLDDSFAQALRRTCSIHWFVDPHSGVAAKLPDRNDLDDSPALDAAVHVAVQHIQDHLLEEVRKICTGWPDVLPSSMKKPEWLFTTELGRLILACLGWKEAERSCHEGNDIWYVHEQGWEINNGTESTFTRKYVAVAQDWVADSINNAVALGASLPWAVLDPKGLRPSVIKQSKPKKDSRNWIALAQEIRLGEHRLPFLLPADLQSEPMILACDADTAVAAIVGKNVQLPNLAADVGDLLKGYAAANDRDQLSDSWGDYDDDCVDTRQVEKDLVEQVSRDFIGGRRAQARQRLHRLQGQLDELHKVRYPIQRLDKRPSVTALRRAVERAERDLECDIKAVKKKAKLPE